MSIRDKEFSKFDQFGNVRSSSGFQVQDVSPKSSNIFFVGEISNGNWRIKKVDESLGIKITYATKDNNPTKTSYVQAWTDRATLNFGGI